ncbi:MAG: S9 family peptidase [Sphingomonas sp.]|nr:S9 family peptidase [Sphingomonas sp.]
MRLSLFILLLASAPALAAHKFEDLAISPKGEAVAAVESEDGAGAHGTIVLRRVSDGRVLRVIDPCAACDYSDPVFAADGRLVFLGRDRAAGTVSLNLADAGGHLRVVATIKGLAEAPRFAPDGKRIAVLVTLNATKETGATQAGARQVGEIGESSDEKRIAVFDLAGIVAGDAVRPISPAGRYVYEYAWTPDGKGFVASTAPGDGDDNWWVATIDAIDASTGAVRPIAKPATQVRFPRISPDGKTIAYIGGLMSDYGSVGGDVWTVPFAGGPPINRTAGLKATITSLVWLKDGLRGTMLAGADAALVRIDDKGKVATFWSKPVGLAAGDAKAAFSLDGRIAASTVVDFEHAAALYAGPVAALAPITHDNDAMPAPVRARSVSWSNGGFQVQGWLLAPANADPAQRAPMIVNVHGGPASAHMPNYIDANGITADLARAGYYIFLPNPRGSYGQGEAFTAANKRDFGGGDLKDILAGIDAVEKIAPVDETRLGLMGGSYGGFMAMWTNTQTSRFKALVAGAGLSDWISYYGINGIDQWMIPFFGKSMYDDPKAYWDVSAIQFIKRAKTPTFIYVGERDIEVPPTQSIEYWHALREMGVPASLVIYPGEGHRLRDPAHAADMRKRTVAWFDTYVKGAR